MPDPALKKLNKHARYRRYIRGLYRHHLERYSKYPPVYRKRIARLQHWCCTLVGPSGNIGGAFTAPFWLPLMIYQFYLMIRYKPRVKTATRRIMGRKINEVPLFPEYLMYLCLSGSDRSTIPGDLQEEYSSVILPKFGEKRAVQWYWTRAICAILWRNAICRWIIYGGGFASIYDWLRQKL